MTLKEYIYNLLQFPNMRSNILINAILVSWGYFDNSVENFIKDYETKVLY